MADRIAFRVGSDTLTSGSRTSSPILPRSDSAYFTPVRVRLDEQRLMERHQPVLVGERAAVVAGEAGFLELGQELRRDVRGDRDAAVPAMGH